MQLELRDINFPKSIPLTKNVDTIQYSVTVCIKLQYAMRSVLQKKIFLIMQQ